MSPRSISQSKTVKHKWLSLNKKLFEVSKGSIIVSLFSLVSRLFHLGPPSGEVPPQARQQRERFRLSSRCKNVVIQKEIQSSKARRKADAGHCHYPSPRRKKLPFLVVRLVNRFFFTMVEPFCQVTRNHFAHACMD